MLLKLYCRLAPDAEVTITEKTVSVKKEKVTVVGELETRVVESSPTFSQTLLPITEVYEGEKVQYVIYIFFYLCFFITLFYFTIIMSVNVIHIKH